MRLGANTFRNKHGNGAARITTPSLREEHLDFAREQVKGDFTVRHENKASRGFPAFWRFASVSDAVLFKLRFSEEARSIA